MQMQTGGARRAMLLAPRLLAGLAALALAGCEAVYTPRPLGDEVVTLDPAEWQGTWLAPDMVITTTVLDGAAGRLQAAWIERGTAGATLEIVEGSVRASGDWTFANILDETESEPPAEAPGGAEPAAEGAAPVASAGGPYAIGYGSPLALDYPTLSGQVAVAIDSGQFLKADPGAARLPAPKALRTARMSPSGRYFAQRDRRLNRSAAATEARRRATPLQAVCFECLVLGTAGDCPRRRAAEHRLPGAVVPGR